MTVNDELLGSIGRGFVVLVGVGKEDREADARYLAEKIANLRVFEDGDGKMNLSLLEVGGEVLAVSQFTLYADCRRGRRPSFAGAAEPQQGLRLYRAFVEELRGWGLEVKEGEFGAFMHVKLVNSGPVTIILDSKKTF